MNVILLSFAVMLSLGGLTTAHAESPCTATCRGEPLPVALSIAAMPSSDDSWSESFWLEDDSIEDFFDAHRPAQMLDATAAVFGVRTYRIDSAWSLREAIAKVANTVDPATGRCFRIAYLDVYSHGHVGIPHFNGIDLSVDNVDQILGNGLECAMVAKAKVQFAGCNIGLGCRGEDFMASVAGQLLKKGGSVEAHTQTAITLTKHLMTPKGGNFQIRRLEVAAGPSRPEWHTDGVFYSSATAALSAQECRDKLATTTNIVGRVSRRYGNCQSTSDVSSQLARVESARVLISDADRAQRDLGAERIGFDAAHLRAAQKFNEAMSNYYLYEDEFKALEQGYCPPVKSVGGQGRSEGKLTFGGYLPR